MSDYDGPFPTIADGPRAFKPGGTVFFDERLVKEQYLQMAPREMRLHMERHSRPPARDQTAEVSKPVKAAGPFLRIACGVLGVALLPFAIADYYLEKRDRKRGRR